MATKARKTVLLVLKIAVAVALLAWVLAPVNWHDYVQQGKQTYSLAGDQTRPGPGGAEVQVHTGHFWNRATQWKPVSQFDFCTKPQVAQGVPQPKATQLDEVKRRGVAYALKTIKVPLVLLAIVGTLISWLVISVRFWYLLKIQEIHLRLWEAVRLTFLGQFFGYIVPGTVGGDLVKAYYVAKHTERKAAVLVTCFVDRVLGLIELMLLAGVMTAAALLLKLAPASKMVWPVAVVGVVAVVATFAAVFLLSSSFRRIFHLQKLYQRWSFAHHIEAAGEAAVLFRKRLPALLKAIMLTVGSQLIWIASVAMIGLSLGLSSGPNAPIPIYSYFVFIPVIYIVAAVPISPGGLGFIELLYTQVAFPDANASLVLLLALIARLVPILCGIPGAVVAITGPKLPKADQMQAELAAQAKA